MAIIRDKKLLALALEWKANPKHANESKFHYKNFEYDYEKEIFPSARSQFQKYNSAYKDNKTFAEAFARDLTGRNSELIAEINKGAKSAEEQIYYEEQPTTQAGTEATPSQQTPVGESPSSMSGGLPFPAASSGTSAPRRVIRVVTQAPQPKIFVANKSGAVTEAGKPSELVKATRSGAIAEAGQPSELVATDRSGRIVKGPGTETPTKQVFTANKSGVVTGVRNIKSPGWLKTFGSNAQIFVKKNLVTGLAGFTGGLGGALASGGNPLAMAGGAFGGVAGKSWLGNGGFAKIDNGLADRVGRLTNLAKTQASTAGKVAQGRTKWVVGALMGFIFLSVAFSAVAPTPQTGQAAPAGQQPSNPAYTPGGGSGIISCPVNGGSVRTGSKDTPGGHCTTGYQTDYPCASPDTTGRSTAVDIAGSDRGVFLPLINGASVSWFIDKIDTDTDYTQNGQTVIGGYSVRAHADSGGKTYNIRFVHLESPNLQEGQLVSSATLVGNYRTTQNHVHITIQEDGVFKPGDLYFNLCK